MKKKRTKVTSELKGFWKSKLCRTMRISLFLIIVGLNQVLAANTYAQNERLNLKMEQATLKSVLAEIESQTEFYFMYDASEINLNQNVDLEYQNQLITEILDEVLVENGISYKIDDRQIALRKLVVENSIVQQKIITGQVTDTDGVPLPGVSVVVKGTNTGVATNINGEYSLEIDSDDAVLVFSYIGYQGQEIPVDGKTVIGVLLQKDVAALNEVVVTALGIKREKKALGYSMSTVNSEQIERSGNTNVLGALQGKVAGLNIAASTGLSDGSSSITLRGISSVAGESQALIVVDGVVYNNDVFGDSNIDRGQGISDINTNDIESVSVLKGPNASALYGSEGANGVIVITTKTKLAKKGLGVSVTSGITFTEVVKSSLPNLQNVYGQGKTTLGEFQGMGDDGIPLIGGSNKDETWGPKMEGQMVRINWLRNQPVVPFLPQPDNLIDLFQKGVNHTNNVAISNSTDKSTYYASFMYNKADEFVPTSEVEKTNVNLRVTHEITSKLSFDGKLSRATTKSHNRPTNDHSSALNFATHPRSIRIQDIKAGKYGVSGITDWENDYWGDGMPILWTTTGNVDQYFWNLNETSNDDKRSRTVGNFKLDYKFTNWLSAMIRYNFNEENSTNSNIKPAYTRTAYEGRYTKNDYQRLNQNTDFLIVANKDFFNDVLNVNGTFGGVHDYQQWNKEKFEGNDFAISGLNTPNNTTSQSYEYEEFRKVKNSMYGTLQLGYKNMLYLDVTARNDWTSRLKEGNNSYFYPSVTGSFIFSEILNIDKRLLNFGKIRASYAEVGDDSAADINFSYDFQNSTRGGTYVKLPRTLPNYDLKPERTKSYEFGVDLNLLNNRIQLDATYYKSNTYNQIVPGMPIAKTSGYDYQTINAGNVENKGVELSLTVFPVKTKNFVWETNLLFADNNSKVIDLGDDLADESQIDLGGNSAVRIVAKPGNSLRTIVGQGFLRNDQGQVLIKTGGSDRGIAMQTDDNIELGKVEADWTAGLKNTFSYKNLSLSFQIDGSFGGEIFAGNNMAFDEQGTSVASLNGREGWMASEAAREAAGVSSDDWHNTGGVDFWVDNNTVLYDESLIGSDGVQVGGIANSGDNAIYSDPRKFWDRNRNDRAEHNIEGATFVKLRELSLSYMLPKKLLSSLPVNDVKFSVIGHNLWLLYRETEHFDPDAYLMSTSKGNSGYTGYTTPATRSLSFKLLVNF